MLTKPLCAEMVSRSRVSLAVNRNSGVTTPGPTVEGAFGERSKHVAFMSQLQ